MTAQIMEVIYIDGKKRYMASEPFGLYLESIKDVPTFSAPHTGCWRGYEGTWEIMDEKLFLVNLHGFIKTPEKEYQDIDLNYFFPNQKKVFAEWFSGELRIPEGKMVNYIHMGYESLYEKDLILELENGTVVSKILVDNV